MRKSVIILMVVVTLLSLSSSSSASLSLSLPYSNETNSIPTGAHILLEHHVYKNGTARAFANVSTPGKIEVGRCLFLINVDIIITDERKVHSPYYIMSRWGWGVSLDDRDIIKPRGIPTIMGPFSRKVTHHLKSVVWAPVGEGNYTFEFATFILCPQTEKVSIAFGNLTVVVNSSTISRVINADAKTITSPDSIFNLQSDFHEDSDFIATNPVISNLLDTSFDKMNYMQSDQQSGVRYSINKTTGYEKCKTDGTKFSIK